ncbi:nitrous oxide reductase accessory protein NosL [Alicycliphilus denitrificans]|uniref:nitrous oxide reductase accessory protein NosL n=1 Tax=Alicycliphilus denitrificans TaxID=179636 RepID=UPI00384F6B2A
MLALGMLAGLGALAASSPWSIPALRAALSSQTAPAPESDVCIVAPPTPYDPATGLAPTAARAIPADARCPVCGMFPTRSPQWAAQIIFTNGDAQFFDSPLSLFMYLQDVARYSPGRSAGQIAAHYVTDATAPKADTGAQWIDALSAYYVHGSSAKGPMRAGNLPAFATREAAQAFAAQRGGTVLAFGAVDADLIAQLAGQGGHSHH